MAGILGYRERFANGLRFTDNGFGNFKLPVIFIGMLLPPILFAAGRMSLDHWLRRRLLAKGPADKALARCAPEWAVE
ncbi:MAG TPA: hypothetical protein VF854_05445 [Azonexus sp.]